MARFTVTGTIVSDIELKTFGTNNNSISKKFQVQEEPKSNGGVAYKFDIEFNGAYAKQVPDNIDLRGAEVVVIGSMISMTSKNGNPMNYLKGERIIIVSYPMFEEEIDVNTGDTVTYAKPAQSVADEVLDDDDLPF